MGLATRNCDIVISPPHPLEDTQTDWFHSYIVVKVSYDELHAILFPRPIRLRIS